MSLCSLPLPLFRYSREVFTREGRLRHIHRLNYWPLDKVLEEKYKFPRAEVRGRGFFLQRCRAEFVFAEVWCRTCVLPPQEEALRKGHAQKRSFLLAPVCRPSRHGMCAAWGHGPRASAACPHARSMLHARPPLHGCREDQLNQCMLDYRSLAPANMSTQTLFLSSPQPHAVPCRMHLHLHTCLPSFAMLARRL